MMTSAPSYPGGGGYQAGGALPPSDSEDSIGVAAASLRLVKRPLATSFAADSCKKRRKQSTPIRISTGSVEASASDDNANNGLAAAAAAAACEGKLGPFLPIHSPTPPIDPTPTPPTEEQLLSHVKLEPLVTSECDRSEDKLSPGSPDDTTGAASPVNLSGGQNFPPWMSDIQVKNDDWLGASSLPVTGMNAMYISIPVSSNTGVVGQPIRTATGQPPIRIFNPEAYCELCNKEFCNKYFLKTHKANKHRIYSEPSTTTEPIGIAVNVPSYTAAKKTPNIPTTSIADIPKNTLDVIGKLNTSNSNNINTPTGFLHTAFCELCGKGFANKILLKAHKISVHGIIDTQPEPSTEISEIDRSVSVTSHNKEDRTDLDDSMINADKENIYKTESLKEEELIINPDDDNSQNTGVPTIPHLGLHQQGGNIDFAANRMRRLGIMNPEAFCEICCKEYCNKYFLRTHKMKRHGILIPDDNSKENQKDFKLELSISNSWYQIQTSPLNLIMGEQNTNSSGSYSERKSSPANENECETCGMRFQTTYLAQLHAATAHNTNLLSLKGSASNNEQEFANSTTPTLPSNNNEKQTTDSISEDLQKLQTMILQLNDLDVSRVSGAVTNSSSGIGGSGNCVCSMCGNEYENRYYLHAHLMTEHGMLLENNPTNPMIEKQPTTENDNNAGTSTLETTTSCKFCGRDGFTADALHLHLVDCTAKSFSISSTTTTTTSACSSSIVTNTIGIANIKKEESNGFASPDKSMRSITSTGGTTASVSTERRSSITLTPANSYCEICNKELCNKYFMKTHMQRMHGIEIENGAQIGGVVCNICNKELCSKYFLRVHKHNTHGIVEEGTGGITPRQNNIDLEPQSSTNSEIPGGTMPSTDTALKPADLSDLSNRYFTHFTEVCTICSRRFRSTKWLKAHLLGDHGKAGTEKWNELEIQLQQSFGQQQQQALRGVKSNHGGGSSISDRVSPTLRVPNGGNDHLKTESGMQNVLHSIFGTDDSNVKQYHCSFCSFSTPVLAFLFVHERSHSQNRPICDMDAIGPGQQGGPNASGTVPTAPPPTNINTSSTDISPLQCAVCNQSFRQPDQLHHHIVTQHSFLSLSSFFGNTGNMVRPPPQTTPLPLEAKPEISPAPSESIVEEQQQQQLNTTNNSDQQCAKCTQCSRVKQNLKSCPELSTDVTITLKDLSKQRQLPATYALPQQLQQQQLKYMMQAFLMDEPSSVTGDAEITVDPSAIRNRGEATTGTGTGIGDDDQQQQYSSTSATAAATTTTSTTTTTTTTDRRFAPSIVFLPVLEKLTAPLTVSFTLTPA